MKFSGKLCLMIMLKALSLEDTFFERPQGGVSRQGPHPF